jgi:hypothetical protein
VALAVVVVLALGVISDLARSGHPSSRPSPPPPVSAVSPSAAARLLAIRALLHERAAAIVEHDESAFMATVDPAETGFWHSQVRMFANLAKVSFASWSYTLDSVPARLDRGRLRRYDAPAWAPAQVALHYRIAGFDTAATDLTQYPTFVKRGVRWYLGSLSDFRSRGEISATDLWDYASVRVVRRPSVLVLGPASQLATMTAVADQAQAAIPEVSAVWGANWSRRVIIQVPATQQEMGRITGDRGDLHQIAALTSAEVSNTPGRAKPVGDRVTINPRTWPTLDRVGATIALTHELTHVASRADTGIQTPKWLAEGFADYVGFRDSGLPVTSIAAELATQVRAGRAPTQLPTNADFNGSAQGLPQAYEGAWLACRYIAERYGQPRLVRFYRAVGTSRATTSRAVATALKRLLGLSRAQFTARWRGYVGGQLA